MEIGLIQRLMHCTVRIECTNKDGECSFGTGFLFVLLEKNGADNVPVFVTNKHVLENGIKAKFQLTLQKNDGSPDFGNHWSIDFDNLSNSCLYHPDPEIDLAIFPAGKLINEAAKNGINFFVTPLSKAYMPSQSTIESFSAMENILMIGYPNALWDSVNNLPIIRRGVTATPYDVDYEGKREFLIDAACFPGSSGSPVFIVNLGSKVDKSGNFHMPINEMHFLGVLYAGPQQTIEGDIHVVPIPTGSKSISVSAIPMNLGFVIKSSVLYDFEPLLEERIKLE